MCTSQAALFFITAPDQPKCVHTIVNQKHAVTAILPTTKRFRLEKIHYQRAQQALCTTLPKHTYTYTYKPTCLYSNIAVPTASESFKDGKLSDWTLRTVWDDHFSPINAFFLQLVHFLLEKVTNLIWFKVTQNLV